MDINQVIQEYHDESDHEIKFRLLIIKLYLQEHSGPAISELLDIGKSKVYFWIDRYRKQGLQGLSNRHRPGRPRKIDYDALREVLADSPPERGYNQTFWDVDLIKQYLLDSQQVVVSQSHIYQLLEQLGIRIKCTCLQCNAPSKSLKTVRGDLITPFHLEVMNEASIMLDAPISRIITGRGIRPVLRVVHRDHERTVLEGIAENGKLTLIYEELPTGSS